MLEAIQKPVVVYTKNGDFFSEFESIKKAASSLNLDRKFIGIEIDEKYFKATEKRLSGFNRNLEIPYLLETKMTMN